MTNKLNLRDWLIVSIIVLLFLMGMWLVFSFLLIQQETQERQLKADKEAIQQDFCRQTNEINRREYLKQLNARIDEWQKQQRLRRLAVPQILI